MNKEEVHQLFHTMAQESNLQSTFNCFNTQSFRQNLSIPDAIWREMEPELREKIMEIRKKLRDQKPSSLNNKSYTPNSSSKPSVPTPNTTSSTTPQVPDQYPSMKPVTTMAHLVNSVANFGLEDGSDDDTDDDILPTSMAFMVKVQQPMIMEVKAHLEYANEPWHTNKVYALADGGADSCILGRHSKVLNYTGRYANLVGYNPETTHTEKVPIVSALIKVQSSTEGGIPILLRINEAPFTPESPITLLSEYQIR